VIGGKERKCGGHRPNSFFAGLKDSDDLSNQGKCWRGRAKKKKIDWGGKEIGWHILLHVGNEEKKERPCDSYPGGGKFGDGIRGRTLLSSIIKQRKKGIMMKKELARGFKKGGPGKEGT